MCLARNVLFTLQIEIAYLRIPRRLEVTVAHPITQSIGKRPFCVSVNTSIHDC